MNSDTIKKGFERAPHRSLLYADGVKREDIDKPFIGVCNSFVEVIPGHVHLNKVAEFIKKEILRSFNEVNAILIDKYRLSADELMCCDCSYLGISNNIIAYMSNSSPAAIRKRKERLKLKLSQMHYSTFFNRGKAINSNTVTH